MVKQLLLLYVILGLNLKTEKPTIYYNLMSLVDQPHSLSF